MKNFISAALSLIILPAAFVACYPEVFKYIPSLYLGGSVGDAGIYIWLTEHSIKNVLVYPSRFFDVGFFYPYGNALAFSDNFLLPALIVKALRLILPGHIYAYNALLLLALLANGVTAFLAAKYITKSARAAVLAGLAFMFSPFIFSHLGQPQLIFAFFLPLSLLATLIFIEYRTWKSAFFIGFIVITAFLTSAYYAMFSVLLSVIVLGSGLLLRFSTLRFRDVAVLIVANLPCLLFLYPFAAPYLAVREAFGGRKLVELEPFPASLVSYLATPSNNVIWGSLSAGLTHYEAYLFPGSIVLLLTFYTWITLPCLSHWYPRQARTGFALRFHGPKTVCLICAIVWLLVSEIFLWASGTKPSRELDVTIAIAFWILILVCVMSLFSEGLKLLRHQRAAVSKDRTSNSWRLTDLEMGLIFTLVTLVFVFASFGLMTEAKSKLTDPGIFMLLFYYFPGYDAIRAASRLGIVATLAISILAAMGLKYTLAAALPKRIPALGVAACILLYCVQVAELRNTGLPLEQEYQAPPIYQTLAGIKDKGVVLAIPSGFIGDSARDFAIKQTKYMQWIETTGRTMLNGYSGKMPKFQEERIPAVSRYFPSPRSLAYLSSVIGLRYIVYHPGEAKEFKQLEFDSQIRNAGQMLKLIARDAEGNYLFELNADREIAATGETEFYLPPDTSKRRFLTFEAAAFNASDTAESTADVNIQLGLELNTPTERTPLIRTFPASSVWRKFTFSLPPSAQEVQPHKVKLSISSSKAEAKVFVRNLIYSYSPSADN